MSTRYKLNEISWPDWTTEFEVQAEMYNLLKNCGLNVRGEVPAACRDGATVRKTRFDLVVYDDSNNPLVIVECKSTKREGFELKEHTNQGRRYKLFGVPIVRCANIHSVAQAKERVLRFL